MKKLLYIGYLLILIIVAIACENTKLINPTDQVSKIDLQVTGLNTLGDSAWYECWIMWTEGEGDNIKNIYESIGLLTDYNGEVHSRSANVNLGYIQRMINLIITIEEDIVPGYRVIVTPTSTDSAKGPSSYKIIAGKVTANSSKFNVGNDLILDFDFEKSQAKYILDTPTDTLNNNPKRGIWFLNLDTTISDIEDSSGTVIGTDTTISQESGLDLPELPNGWIYEGWIIMNSDTVSIGTFVEPYGADDSSKYGAGTAGGYNFPGEDFIENPPPGIIFPTDLSGKQIFITIDAPHPATSYTPFRLIPYISTVPMNCESKTNYSMQNNSESFPNGSIIITVTIYE